MKQKKTQQNRTENQKQKTKVLLNTTQQSTKRKTKQFWFELFQTEKKNKEFQFLSFIPYRPFLETKNFSGR